MDETIELNRAARALDMHRISLRNHLGLRGNGPSIIHTTVADLAHVACCDPKVIRECLAGMDRMLRAKDAAALLGVTLNDFLASARVGAMDPDARLSVSTRRWSRNRLLVLRHRRDTRPPMNRIVPVGRTARSRFIHDSAWAAQERRVEG